MHSLHHRIKDLDFHAAVTIEGRDDSELPEQELCAARIRGLDLPNLASTAELPEP